MCHLHIYKICLHAMILFNIWPYNSHNAWILFYTRITYVFFFYNPTIFNWSPCMGLSYLHIFAAHAMFPYNIYLWGIPLAYLLSFNVIPSITNDCALLSKYMYDFIHCKASPDIPKSSCWSMILWSIVSKATERSRVMTATSQLWCSASVLSLCSLSRAVYVEWCFL